MRRLQFTNANDLHANDPYNEHVRKAILIEISMEPKEENFMILEETFMMQNRTLLNEQKTSIITCNYCKKPGHLIRDCRALNYEQQQNNGPQNQLQNNQNNRPQCQKCGRNNHVTRDY